MKRIALLAAVAMLFMQQAIASPWLNTVAAAQKKAKEKNQLIFVDLFADWCGWCHRFEQEVIPSQAFQQATDNMVLLRLNTEDGKDGTKFAQQFSITTLPTFLVLTNDLLIAGTIHGYEPPSDFARTLTDTEGKYKDFAKRVDSESTFAKDYQKRLDLAKEFRSRAGFAQSETRLRKLLDESALPVAIRDESYYELALNQVFEKKYDDANKTIAKFATVQNKGEAFERSRLLIGDIFLQKGNILSAVNEYRNFKTRYPNSQYVRNVEIILPQLERQLAAAGTK